MKHVINDIEPGKKVWVVYANIFNNSRITPELVTVGEYYSDCETLMPRKEIVLENGDKIPGGMFVNESCFDTKEEAENEIECRLKKEKETENYRREFYRGAARGFMFKTGVHFDDKEKQNVYIKGFIDGCMMLHKERENN